MQERTCHNCGAKWYSADTAGIWKCHHCGAMIPPPRGDSATLSRTTETYWFPTWKDAARHAKHLLGPNWTEWCRIERAAEGWNLHIFLTLRCPECKGELHLRTLLIPENGSVTASDVMQCNSCRRIWPLPGEITRKEDTFVLKRGETQ